MGLFDFLKKKEVEEQQPKIDRMVKSYTGITKTHTGKALTLAEINELKEELEETKKENMDLWEMKNDYERCSRHNEIYRSNENSFIRQIRELEKKLEGISEVRKTMSVSDIKKLKADNVFLKKKIEESQEEKAEQNDRLIAELAEERVLRGLIIKNIESKLGKKIVKSTDYHYLERKPQKKNDPRHEYNNGTRLFCHKKKVWFLLWKTELSKGMELLVKNTLCPCMKQEIELAPSMDIELVKVSGKHYFKKEVDELIERADEIERTGVVYHDNN